VRTRTASLLLRYPITGIPARALCSARAFPKDGANRRGLGAGDWMCGSDYGSWASTNELADMQAIQPRSSG